MKKRFISLALALLMVLSMIPWGQVQLTAEAATDNGKLTMGPGNTAYCAVCEKTVTWKRLDGDITAAIYLQDGLHYYLAGDLNSTAVDGAIAANTTAGNAACLHLNGFNITATGNSAIHFTQSTPGTLNILGNGTVTGSNVTDPGNRWRAATINVANGATVNLYGGTYGKKSSNAPTVWIFKGQVNLYEGAKLTGNTDSVSSYSSTVYLQNAEAGMTMYGGEIAGGKNLNSGGNVCVNNGSFTMNGGKITGGVAQGYHGGNIYVVNGSFTMTGGSISGGAATYHGANVYVNTNGTARIAGGTVTGGTVQIAADNTKTTLAGAPVIDQLKLPSGAKITVDGLSCNADVAVNASAGTFTNAGASASLGAFRTYNGTDSILARADGSLAYISNGKLSLDANKNGYCPVCDETVTWVGRGDTVSAAYWLAGGNHYYLYNNLTGTGSDGAFYVNVPEGSSVCLHLNGYNITTTGNGSTINFYQASGNCGTLNIMGTGTVSGSSVVAGSRWQASTLNVKQNATLNLYGGTYTKDTSDAPVLWIWAGLTNLFSGAKLAGNANSLSTYSSTVFLQNAEANLHMYGGEISGGTNYNSGGNVNINNGTFVMDGGKISGGTAKNYHGGNIYVKNTAGAALGKPSFTMNGGTVTGGSATYFGSNIYIDSSATAAVTGGSSENGIFYVAAAGTTTISGAPKLSRLLVKSGATTDLGTLVSGTKINIIDPCATTADAATLQTYVDAGYFTTTLEGMRVAVNGSSLVLEEAPAEPEEPEVPAYTGPVYFTGDVLYETNFSDETVGQLPEGWSAGYSEGSGENKTGFGWGSNGSITAKVVETASGKAFQFNSGNNDAFVAMGEIPTTNYLYEATVQVDRGYGSFGLANNYYASTDKATGALFSSIYPKGDASKYTYKGTGRSGSQPWTTSYNPASGDVIHLQILSLNGQNYIMYEGQIVAQCAARLSGQTVDHPGFYACYGGIYVLGVKVTEVFAADVRVVSGKVTSDTISAEIDFDKTQGIYRQLYSGAYTFAEDAALRFGVMVTVGSAPDFTLDRNTEGAMEMFFTEGYQTEELLRMTVSAPLQSQTLEMWYTLRPFVLAGESCFYGDAQAYRPASLANGAYRSGNKAQQEALVETFGGCAAFTAADTGSVTFTLFSDFHYQPDMYPSTVSDLKTILARADAANADFVLSAGDFSNDMKGSPELVNTFRQYETAEGYILPAYNVYGNHELEFGNSMEDVTWTLTNDEYTDHDVVWGTADGSFNSDIGYYYFQQSGFRVIALDSEYSYNPTTGLYEHNKTGSSGPASGNTKAGSLGPDQLAWLEQVLLDAADQGISCIVIAHDGFGPDWCDTSPDTAAVQALYRKANDKTPGTVLMSINGHIHTDHQGWLDGVFYLDTNTVRNTWWQETAVAHYTDEHTYTFEEYDDQGNLVATYEKKYSDLTMGAKTWFSEDPISCNVTVSKDGSVTVDGVKSRYAHGIAPTGGVADGTKPEITSGDHWNCDLMGHDLQVEVSADSYCYVCRNSLCGYVTAAVAHDGYLDMGITAVTLRPSAAGIYYKAKFVADPTLAARVKNYGVVLSLNDMPDADFRTAEDINLATVAAAPFTSGVEVTSGSVFGILKESSRNNIARSQMTIYANVYVELDDGTILMGGEGSGAAWSLRDVMNAISENYEELSKADQLAFDAFLDYWAPYISES